MDALSLQKLLSWLSPSFPVGAFAWSSGLEAMAQSERISNSESLRTWLEAGLRHGIWHNDAILLCAAFRGNEIREVNNLALALCAGRERYDETIALGKAFRDAASQWHKPPKEIADLLPAYPVIVGYYAKMLDLDLEMTTTAFLHSTVSNQIQAALRLTGLGQKAGLIVLREMENPIQDCARRAMETPLEEIGAFAPMMDIASMNHETLTSRIFRS